MSDEDAFQSMLGDDVKPIKVESREEIKKTPATDKEALQRRRIAAENTSVDPKDPLAGAPVDMVQPLDVIAFQRPGVQHGVFRNLRLGKYQLDAHLDLHKKTIEQARRELYQFVQDCVANDVRSAIITHGKGEGRDKPALLKSHVAFWLPQMEDILAFHTAQKKHGSYGATYILIRKSPQKKLETRETIYRK